MRVDSHLYREIIHKNCSPPISYEYEVEMNIVSESVAPRARNGISICLFISFVETSD